MSTVFLRTPDTAEAAVQMEFTACGLQHGDGSDEQLRQGRTSSFPAGSHMRMQSGCPRPAWSNRTSGPFQCLTPYPTPVSPPRYFCVVQLLVPPRLTKTPERIFATEGTEDTETGRPRQVWTASAVCLFARQRRRARHDRTGHESRITDREPQMNADERSLTCGRQPRAFNALRIPAGR